MLTCTELQVYKAKGWLDRELCGKLKREKQGQSFHVFEACWGDSRSSGARPASAAVISVCASLFPPFLALFRINQFYFIVYFIGVYPVGLNLQPSSPLVSSVPKGPLAITIDTTTVTPTKYISFVHHQLIISAAKTHTTNIKDGNLSLDFIWF